MPNDMLVQPSQVTLRAGCIGDLPQIVSQMQARHVCLLLDPFIAQSAMGAKIRASLGSVRLTRVDSISREPTFNLIHALCAALPLQEIDLFIAVGGGSVLDTAKILSAVSANPAFEEDLSDASRIQNRPVPLVAAPTTAGTGAEATPNAILLDEAHGAKVGIVSPQMVACRVLLDSDLTATMPAALCASTGLDALAHALESYISTCESPFLETFAFKAVSLILGSLEQAAAGDRAARERMQLASFYAGSCLVVSNTCAVHAIAYPLSGIYHVPHGVSIAALLPDTIALLQDACAPKLATLARHCGLCGPETPDAQAAACFMQRLLGLRDALGARYAMRSYGVEPERYTQMARDALSIRRLFDYSPRGLSVEEIVSLYKAIQG